MIAATEFRLVSDLFWPSLIQSSFVVYFISFISFFPFYSCFYLVMPVTCRPAFCSSLAALTEPKLAWKPSSCSAKSSPTISSWWRLIFLHFFLAFYIVTGIKFFKNITSKTTCGPGGTSAHACSTPPPTPPPTPLNQLATLFCKLASTFYALHSTQAPSKQTQTSLSACAHGFFSFFHPFKITFWDFLFIYFFTCMLPRGGALKFLIFLVGVNSY